MSHKCDNCNKELVRTMFCCSACRLKYFRKKLGIETIRFTDKQEQDETIRCIEDKGEEVLIYEDIT